MNILIYIATWQRMEITRLCYHNLHRFIAANPQHNWQVLIVCSEAEHVTLAKQNGFHTCLTDNFPVGAKMNTGLADAINLQWDYLMQLGSDDVLNPKLMQHYDELLTAGAHIIGVHSAVYVDLATQRAKTFCYEEGRRVLGAARIISRHAIERSAVCVTIKPRVQLSNGNQKYYRNQPICMPIHQAQSYINSGHADIVDGTYVVQLWKPDANRALDHYSQKSLSAQGFEPVCIQIDNMVFDIKSDTNIWSYDDLPGTNVDFEFAISHIDLSKFNQPKATQKRA